MWNARGTPGRFVVLALTGFFVAITYWPAASPANEDDSVKALRLVRPIASSGLTVKRYDGWARGVKARVLDAAIEQGCAFLVSQQDQDGSFAAGSIAPTGRIGVTGLAASALMAAGYRHGGSEAPCRTLRRAIRYLIAQQDDDGCFGPKTVRWIFNHAFAAEAVVRVCGDTGFKEHVQAAQRALVFHGLSRNPYYVWRYGMKPGDNDTAVTGAIALAFFEAQRFNSAHPRTAGLRPFALDEDAPLGISAWLDKMTDPDYGRIGYVTRGSGPKRYESLHGDIAKPGRLGPPALQARKP